MLPTCNRVDPKITGFCNLWQMQKCWFVIVASGSLTSSLSCSVCLSISKGSIAVILKTRVNSCWPRCVATESQKHPRILSSDFVRFTIDMGNWIRSLLTVTQESRLGWPINCFCKPWIWNAVSAGWQYLLLFSDMQAIFTWHLFSYHCTNLAAST
jgi:hypothetical protein